MRRRTQNNPFLLTHRELHILQLLAEGASNKDSANITCRSIRTIECHVAAVLGKLGVKNRVLAAVHFARQYHELNSVSQ
jgi:DNA-binding NarL/FixJ family response regulator